jgi:UDP-N-acetylmuramate--alanine ligase
MSSLPAPLPFGLVASKFTGKRVHFIGIAGSGMSGLARILLDAGARVSGTETKPSFTTIRLQQHGARITYEQDGSMLSAGIDLVVRTAAVKDSNPEFVRATELSLPHVKYAQLLGEVMGERVGVAVAGTHGKSTTTAMTAYILTRLGMDPSWVVGGTVPQLGGSSHSGAGAAFVAEACEYDRSFHNLRPTHAIVTNIDADHLDVYGSLDEIIESFRVFGSLVPAGDSVSGRGRIITLAGDDAVAKALHDLDVAMDLVGFSDTRGGKGLPLGAEKRRWTIEQKPEQGGLPRAEVTIIEPDSRRNIVRLELSVPGRHNLLNGTMAVAAAVALGADPAAAALALTGFTGVDRRMQVLGTHKGATIVDDYGHHPTEVRATLEALRRRFAPKRLYCVFQPHQASRTRLLFEEFAAAFTDADEVVLADIYYVRDSDEDRRNVTSGALADAIRRNGTNARHVGAFSACAAYVSERVGEGDLVVTMGAGPICEVAQELAGVAGVGKK